MAFLSQMWRRPSSAAAAATAPVPIEAEAQRSLVSYKEYRVLFRTKVSTVFSAVDKASKEHVAIKAYRLADLPPDDLRSVRPGADHSFAAWCRRAPCARDAN